MPQTVRLKLKVQAKKTSTTPDNITLVSGSVSLPIAGESVIAELVDCAGFGFDLSDGEGEERSADLLLDTQGAGAFISVGASANASNNGNLAVTSPAYTGTLILPPASGFAFVNPKYPIAGNDHLTSQIVASGGTTEKGTLFAAVGN